MKLPDKYGARLNTENYKEVKSAAATSIDYYPKLKIIEIEFSSGSIYHYLNVKKPVWNKFLAFAAKGKGLGEFISQFKQPYNDGVERYYELKT